jgi:hypothetical protein
MQGINHFNLRIEVDGIEQVGNGTADVAENLRASVLNQRVNDVVGYFNFTNTL